MIEGYDDIWRIVQMYKSIRLRAMIKTLLKFMRGEAFRYLIFGILTVVVNIAVYQLLSLIWASMAANTTAFFAALLFAYWTNSTFVFRTPHTWMNFLQFVGMRIGTLLIDDGGMYLLLALSVNGLLAKCIVNSVITVVNYLISKLIVFRKK